LLNSIELQPEFFSLLLIKRNEFYMFFEEIY
jgi:hypothetical protein